MLYKDFYKLKTKRHSPLIQNIRETEQSPESNPVWLVLFWGCVGFVIGGLVFGLF